ncbi:MAG: sugar-binding protein [Phycisphaeraceae bacterium]
MSIRAHVMLVALVAGVAWPAGMAAAEPWGFFLTWQRDPSTTMTVQWLEPGVPVPLVDGQQDAPRAFELPHVGEVAIDGDAAAWWTRGLEIALLGDENQQHPPHNALSAQGRVGWNDEGLLIAVRVRDDNAIEYPEISQLWAGDSVEMFVSDGVGSNHRYQVLVTPALDPAQEERRQHFLSGGSAPPADELTLTAASRATRQGYEMEILLPWANLPELDPEAGADVGLQIYVNDRSTPPDAGLREGRQRVLWYPAADAWNNPHSMHALRLTRGTTDSAGRVRLVHDAEAGSLDVYAPLGMAGETVRVTAGHYEISELSLTGRDNVAHARVDIPAPPDGRQWGALTAWHGDTFAGHIALARRHDPPDAGEITFWPEGDEAAAETLEMQRIPIDGWPAQFIQRVELTNLEPDTAYRFRADGAGREYAFGTMPSDLSRPVRVALGGDVRHNQAWMQATNRVAMQYEPDVIVWGGDLAYANGQAGNIHLWVEWFEAIDNTLVSQDGRIVPIVLAIGNHEVRGGYYHSHSDFQPTNAWRLSVAPYFYQLFAFPGHPGYGVLDFGQYMSIIVLDTDHTNPIEDQSSWLEQTLAERAHVPHVLPVYHVPGYPSHRAHDGLVSQRVREHWSPLFEGHGVEVAFENHDHAYKRTPPIRAGRPHPAGVVYIGDGAWGVGTRAVHDPAETWYLAHAESTRHAIIMTLDGPHRHFLMVSDEGEVIDEYPRRPGER